MHSLVVHPRHTVTALVAAYAGTAAALYLFWPAGVILGLFVSLLAVIVMGRRMVAAADSAPHDGSLELDPHDDLREEVRRLREALGDDFEDFARAAALVVDLQRAPVSAVQKGLGVSQGRARYLVGLLERERFLAPPVGNRSREVLVSSDHLGRLREVFGLAA